LALEEGDSVGEDVEVDRRQAELLQLGEGLVHFRLRLVVVEVGNPSSGLGETTGGF